VSVIKIFDVEFYSWQIALASGKKRSVPYSAIASTWEDYIDPIYLPRGISFMEISRYKGAETHSILALWRARQEKGEIAFRFGQYVGPEKEPRLALYNEEIFEGLLDAVHIDPHISQSRLDSDSQEDEDEEDSEAPWPRQSMAADPIDESGGESEESERVDPLTGRAGETDRIGEHQQGSDGTLPIAATQRRPGRTAISPTYDDPPRERQNRRPAARAARARRKVIESEEDDNARTTPQTRRVALPIIDSSPTLAGSSPLVQKPMRGQRLSRLRAPQDKVLPTPEASQTSTPVPPEGSRSLRSGTKAMANAKAALDNAAGMEAEAVAVDNNLKGKMKQAGIKAKGQKKKG